MTLWEDRWRCFTGRCILRTDSGNWTIHDACQSPDGVIDHKLKFSDSWGSALSLCLDAIKDLQDSRHLTSALSSLIFGLLLIMCSALQSVMRQYRVLGWFSGYFVLLGCLTEV